MKRSRIAGSIVTRIVLASVAGVLLAGAASAQVESARLRVDGMT